MSVDHADGGSGKATRRARGDMGQASRGRGDLSGQHWAPRPVLRVKPELEPRALRMWPSQHRPTETRSVTWQACACGGCVTGDVDAEGHHSPCLMTVMRTPEVLLPAEETTEQRYSVLSPTASRSQLSAWVLPSRSAWVCVGTHVCSSRPFFSQVKRMSAGPGDADTSDRALPPPPATKRSASVGPPLRSPALKGGSSHPRGQEGRRAAEQD